MLFISTGIVYWLNTLLHQCDNNAIFIVDVSSVYALSSSEDRQDTKSKLAHTLHFWKFSEWCTNKRMKYALEIPKCWIISQVLTIYKIFDQMAWLKMNLVGR